MSKSLIFFIMISCFVLPMKSWGQASADSTLALSTTRKKAFHPIPKRALLFGLIPGGGQVYNRKYWKVPLVYAGLGFATYMIIDNKKKYNRYQQARIYRLDGDSTTVDEFAGLYSDEALFKIRAIYDKNVQKAYIWTGVVYSLSIIDAFVDAHLSNFDVSDDLSIRWMPSTLGGTGYGLSIALEF
ncbi:MAG TPA: hypothetical protein ENK85_10630 [Saprospiraceae bacterium]|nr:hypothetical protein [Saprospiraceae bacterium]